MSFVGGKERKRCWLGRSKGVLEREGKGGLGGGIYARIQTHTQRERESLLEQIPIREDPCCHQRLIVRRERKGSILEPFFSTLPTTTTSSSSSMTNFRGVAQDDSEQVYYLLYCRTSDKRQHRCRGIAFKQHFPFRQEARYRNPERAIQYFLKDGFTSGPVTIPYFDVHTKM